MASEPWYSIGPLDVFPEEFPPFLFADAGQRKLFDELHGELYNADYWKGLQAAIRAGKVIDVFPYRRKDPQDEGGCRRDRGGHCPLADCGCAAVSQG